MTASIYLQLDCLQQFLALQQVTEFPFPAQAGVDCSQKLPKPSPDVLTMNVFRIPKVQWKSKAE